MTAASRKAQRGAQSATVTPSAARREPRWWSWGAVAPLLLAVAVYLPSQGGSFMYDDTPSIVTNPAIRNLGAWRAIVAYEPARPVVTLSWAVNYALAGLTPWPYHLTNVVIHALNSALLFSLLLAVGLWRKDPWSRQRALLGAGLFAATPMAVESVAYVSSRSTLLASCFVLLTLRFGLRALRGSTVCLVLTPITFVLGLATKEETIVAPALLALVDFVWLRHEAAVTSRRRLSVYAPLVGLAGVGVIGRRLVTGAWLPEPAMDHGIYLLTQLAAFPRYILRALVPLAPSLFRGEPPAPWPPGVAAAFWSVAGLTLIGAAIALRRRVALFSVAIAWMAICLAPSSSILPLREMVVDHRAYLGGAFLLYLLACLWKPGRAVPFLLLLAAFAGRAYHAQWVLADPIRAWEDVARRAPASPIVYRALGDAYLTAGDWRAEAALRKAVALDPQDAESWTNLGVLLVRQDRFGEAEVVMRRAIELAPRLAQLRENLGLILQAQGKDGEAISAFENAIVLAPELAAPRIDLAEVLLRQGDVARALVALDAAEKLAWDAHDRELIAALRSRLPGAVTGRP
jgi:protein O-mannosyl-transferase